MELRPLTSDATSVTFEYDPVPGATGYRFSEAGVAKRPHSWDPQKHTIRFAKGHEWYKAEALGVVGEGIYPPAAVVLPKFGVSTGATLNHRAPADQDYELDQCRLAGAQTIRIDMWRQGESLAYTVIDKIRQRSMDPFLCIGGTRKDWTQPTPAEWATWAGQQATILGPRVNHFEINNEPDLNNCTPEIYTEVLKRAHDAIKAANPNAIIVAGALWKWDGGTTANPAAGCRGWVERMYAAGAKDYFDILSLHLYDDALAAGDWNIWNHAFAFNPSVRSIMDAHGDQAKPIISTESGGPVTKYGEPGQATIIKNAMADPRIPLRFVFTMMDDVVPGGFGMLRPDHSQRQGWIEFQKAAA